jgi:hypothetical protein
LGCARQKMLTPTAKNPNLASLKDNKKQWVSQGFRRKKNPRPPFGASSATHWK